MANGVWELISGPLAEEIEALNRANLMNLLIGLVKSMLASPTADGAPTIPGETALRRLHHAATVLLVEAPGQYRDFEVHTAEGGEVVFRGQPSPSIEARMADFFDELAALWQTGDALDVAALALWRINWIHPFADGNGRTAIAFSYACLCLKLGTWLPRAEIVIGGITENPARYLAALRVANRSLVSDSGRPDLSAVKALLDELLLRQMTFVSLARDRSRCRG